MRLNKFLTLLTIPFLCACQQIPEYNGPKLILDYVEEGGLKEISPTQLYDITISRGKDSVVLFSVEGCSSCEKTKNEMKSVAIGYHVNLYTVNMSAVEVNSDDYLYIVNSTTYLDSLYRFPDPENATYPLVYFYKEKGIALTRQSQITDALRMYVSVSE